MVVLEAMKMEHVISAPLAGTVQELHVSPGEQVDAGRPLALVEPAAAAGPEDEERDEERKASDA
ncbi:acetyl-CoA carboxylase biotin carboxyl carrier protein subunit [compost metagenome]